MLHPKTLYTFLFIILAGLCIPSQARTDTICDFCGASIPSGQSYCDKCGNWISSVDNEIKYEFSATAGYNHANMNAVFTMGDGDDIWVSDWENTYDTVTLAASYRFYLKPRYQHPDVPFAFIPYNYRSNFLDIAAARVNDEYTYDDKGDYPNYSKLEYNARLFSVNTLYYFDRVFVGGGLDYTYQTRDDFESDDWLNQAVILSGTFGFHNPRHRIGMNIQFHDLSYDRSYKDDDAQFFRLKPFVEYLPTPKILLGIGLDYFLETGSNSSYYELKIPLLAKYIMTEHWWEFVASFSYYNNENDINEYDLQVGIRKFFHDISVHLLSGYFRRTNDFASGAFEYVKVQAGADIALCNRTILLGTSGYYHSGESSFVDPAPDYDNYGINGGLHLFFH